MQDGAVVLDDEDRIRLLAHSGETVARVHKAFTDDRCALTPWAAAPAFALAALAHVARLQDRLHAEFVDPDGDDIVLRILGRAHMEAALNCLYVTWGGQDALLRVLATHRRVIENNLHAAENGLRRLEGLRQSALDHNRRARRHNRNILGKFGPGDPRLFDEVPVPSKEDREDVDALKWYLSQFPDLDGVVGLTIEGLADEALRLGLGTEVDSNFVYDLYYRSMSWMGAHPTPWVIQQYLDDGNFFIRARPEAAAPPMGPAIMTISLVWTCFAAQEVLGRRGIDVTWFADLALSYHDAAAASASDARRIK